MHVHALAATRESRRSQRSLEHLHAQAFIAFARPGASTYGSRRGFGMLQVARADQVLSALQTVTKTDEVRRNLDLELFELNLLDSLGIVELLVQLSDRLGLELSPTEFDRDQWATPRKILAVVEARLEP